MRVAVTGGSGVVGTAVVRHLVEAGEEVWALARSPEASAKLDGLGAHVVHGDLFEGEPLARLVKGSRRVFHVAGVNEMCSLHPEVMWSVNVDGARAVLLASEGAGVERLIHTSSAVTIGEPRGTVGTERGKHRGHFLSQYERSKTVAERLLFNHVGNVEVVSVNPSSVQGPGRSTGTGALLLAAARGDLPFLVDTTFSLVDVDDCARGHLRAADRGEPGERYILSAFTLTARDAVRELSRRMGRRRSPRFVKPEVLTAVAPVAEAMSRALGRQPVLCPESARVLLNGHSYDGTKATRDLGLEYTSFDETLGRTLEWFRDQGLV
jgi:dihydroflavonol-4-reductase